MVKERASLSKLLGGVSSKIQKRSAGGVHTFELAVPTCLEYLSCSSEYMVRTSSSYPD